MPQPLLDRLSDLLRRIDAGEWDPTTVPASDVRRIAAGLARVRDLVAAYPEDWPERVLRGYLHGEIGYWLMENSSWVETDLGRKVLQVTNDLGHKVDIVRALRTVREAAQEHPAEPSLSKMESLLLKMSDAFDEGLFRDEARLEKLGKALCAVVRPVRREASHSYWGQLEDDVVAVTLEYRVTQPDPSSGVYESHDPRVAVDISRQLEVHYGRSDPGAPAPGAGTIAPCVRRARWGERGLTVEWQEARWGSDFYRWDDLADAGYTFLDLAVSEGVVTGIATGGVLVQTKAGAWFVVSANGERYQDLAHMLCGHVWNQRAEAEGAEEEDTAPGDGPAEDTSTAADPPWSRPRKFSGDGKTILERFDDVFRRIGEGDRDFAAIPPSNAARITEALTRTREILAAHPDDWDRHLPRGYLTAEIGLFLMEALYFTDTDLGGTILWLINDVSGKGNVLTALRAVRTALSAHPPDPALQQLASVVAAMDEALDRGFYPDTTRRRQLGEALIALVDGEARHLYRGELEDCLGRLIATTPWDPD